MIHTALSTIASCCDKHGLFPNGFNSYRETLSLIMRHIGILQGSKAHPSKIWESDRYGGQVNLMELAHEWAMEFEQSNKGRVWHGEWIEELQDYTNNKIDNL